MLTVPPPPFSQCKPPRTISLVVKIVSAPAELGRLSGPIGLMNMIPEIDSYLALEHWVYRHFDMTSYDSCEVCFHATTRPSVGALMLWDLVEEPMDEKNWDAVMNVAELQGWLGVSIRVGDCEPSDVE